MSAAIASAITAEISGWEGVSAEPHRFGGTEFRFGGHEIGHLHGGRQADLPFPVRVREELVSAGKASLHHMLPETGWVTFYIKGEADITGALELFRLSYDRLRARRAPDRSV